MDSGASVRVGLALGRVDPARWPALTELADRLGYESVWLPEHLVLPVDITGSPFGGSADTRLPSDTPVFDVFGCLGFLAGRTRRIRVGTQVYNVGLRHPFVTARGVATVDVLSGGRFEFGVGVGWLATEWAATGLDFASRGRRVDECLQVCQRLWTEPVVAHQGEFFQFGPVAFEPKPTQRPWPPLHVGGDSPAALRRVAQFGDGWLPLTTGPDRLPAALRTLTELRRRSDRQTPVQVTLTVPEVDRAVLDRLAESGVHRVIVSPWRSSADALPAVRRLAEELSLPPADEDG